MGTPVGEVVIATIGPDGGTLTSADGFMDIVIPPGAVASPVQVGVQIVTNHAFGGIGNAYRLSPRDLVLTRPARLSFHYTDAELGGMFVEAMSVAVQDRDGHWHGKQTVTRDIDTSTLVVSTMSLAVKPDATARRGAPADAPDAGSDWTKSWTFRVVPASARVKVKDTLNVELQFCRRDKPTVGWPIEDAHELHHCVAGAPLSGVDVGQWSVMGPGTIKEGKAGKTSAVYTAPDAATDQLRCLTAGEWSACAQVHLMIVVNGQNVGRIASTGIEISDCPFLRSAGAVCAPTTWVGTATYDDNFDDGTVAIHNHVETMVTWTLDPREPTGHAFVPTGRAVYSSTGHRGPCDWSLAPTPLSIAGTLQFNSIPPSYIVIGRADPIDVELDYTLSCDGGATTVRASVPAWIDVPLSQPAPDNPPVIAGRFAFSDERGDTTSSWSFTRQPAPEGAAHMRAEASSTR